MSTNKDKTGFTLVEIMIAIAIIGVLSTIVMASLSSTRGKSANASIKSSLSNARAQAELFHETNGASRYIGVCLTANSAGGEESVRRFFESAHSQSIATQIGDTQATPQPNTDWSVCRSNADNWVISVPLKVQESIGGTVYSYFCVDWAGTVSIKVNPLANNALSCPAT